MTTTLRTTSMLAAMSFALALLVPALAAAQTPIVAGQAFDMPSRIEGEQRHVTVWLPPSYEAGKG